jgi:hypothetical protein
MLWAFPCQIVELWLLIPDGGLILGQVFSGIFLSEGRLHHIPGGSFHHRCFLLGVSPQSDEVVELEVILLACEPSEATLVAPPVLTPTIVHDGCMLAEGKFRGLQLLL